MDEKKNIVSTLLQNIATTFACAIIGSSVIIWFLSEDQGLYFPIIAQLLAFCIIVSIMEIVITSDLLFKNMLLLWRYILLLFLTLVTCGIFVIVFDWFSIDNWVAWTGLMTTLTVFFVIGTVPMIVKTKLEDRRYHKLLSDYKSKHDLAGKCDK